ncbi:NAD-binding protein [Escherichia coli]
MAPSMGSNAIPLVILNRLASIFLPRKRVKPMNRRSIIPAAIIAGFGRFGRSPDVYLLSSGVKTAGLDHDPDHIETLRKFGMKVFMAMPRGWILLESAGAAKAEVPMNAIDDPKPTCNDRDGERTFPAFLRSLPAPAMSTTTFVCVSGRR